MVLSVWVGKRRSAKGSRGGKADFNQIKEQTRSELLLDGISSWGQGTVCLFVRAKPCSSMFSTSRCHGRMCPEDRGEPGEEEEEEEGK